MQAALYALAVRERLGLDVAGALYQPIGRADQRPRGLVRDDVPGRYVNGDVVDGATLDETLAGRARGRRAGGGGAARGRGSGRARTRCSSRGTCAHPGICRAMTPPAFTREQRAAIAARTGSSLLAANAGSGKTAVMVERIVAAVREDGVPVGAILALTFTEKAAGELGERLRRRLTELGEDEHARAVDAAWIGTIHGFCARLLRSQPLAAGLDPRFEVLEEAPAGRLAAAAYERALEAWARAEGAAAIDLAAAYGPGLRELILGAYATLRARGLAAPRLTDPAAGAAPGPAALAAAAGRPRSADLATAGEGVRVAAARAALEARCAELGRATACRGPARSTPPSSRAGRRR